MVILLDGIVCMSLWAYAYGLSNGEDNSIGARIELEIY